MSKLFVRFIAAVIVGSLLSMAIAQAAVVTNSQGSAGQPVAAGTSTPVEIVPPNANRYEVDLYSSAAAACAFGSLNPTSGAFAAPTPEAVASPASMGAPVPIPATTWMKFSKTPTTPDSGFRKFIDDEAQVQIDCVCLTGSCNFATIEKTRPTSIP